MAFLQRACLFPKHRARDKNDHYSWSDYAKELGGSGLSGAAVAGAGITLAGLAAPATAPALAATGTAIGLLGAVQLVWTKVKRGLDK